MKRPAFAPDYERNEDLDRRFRVLYVQLNTQTYAGIERVVDSMCDLLLERYGDKFEIDVLFTSIQKDRPFKPRKFTEIRKISEGKIGLMRSYRNAAKEKRYDLIVVPQIEPAVIFMTACLGLRQHFVTYLHGNPEMEKSHIKAKILFLLMKLVFASELTAAFGVSKRQLECFGRMFGEKVPRYLLPNPVRLFDHPQAEKANSADCITFINVARFDLQKGQDLLLCAFAELVNARPNARLRLIGYGKTEAELRQLIDRLGLADVVSIEHSPTDPSEALASSDVYVSISRWEGWSLAICEALRFGLPVISTDCDFGPSEILVDRRLGALVPLDDQKQLLRRMMYYCDNLSEERQHRDFRKDFVKTYDPDRVVEVHAACLQAAIAGGRHLSGNA